MTNISIYKKRISQYLDYKGISHNAFYKETNISNGVLSKKSGLTLDTLGKFISKYPDINPEWLLTGKGNMLLHEASPGASAMAMCAEQLAAKDTLLQAKDDLITAKDALIKLLESQKEGYEARIQELQNSKRDIAQKLSALRREITHFKKSDNPIHEAAWEKLTAALDAISPPDPGA